uniref:Threonylcarbamoyl-AMP synthase n=1 Tax=Schistosoma japonicum TaxID=6182 RepID=Q5DEG8_SCHJA|nr:SJCHGC02454 protein [Schistosoma japonicum]
MLSPKLFHILAHTYPVMNNKIITLKDASLNLNTIVQLISHGCGVIALPTDTVYGLACSVYNTESIERIRHIKGRSETKPMAICLDQVSHISHWCDTKNIPTGLLSDLLPGPVTVLLPRFPDKLQDPLNCHLNPGERRVGIRIPDSGFIRKLISALHEQTKLSSTSGNDEYSGGGHPLVLTSANLSGQPSAIQIEEFSEIWPSIDLIVNGGPIQPSLPSVNLDYNRSGSTIIDLCDCDKSIYYVVRSGSAYDATVAVLEDRYNLSLAKY